MPLTAFDHVNIRTANLNEMVDWYEKVLGLTNGPRPEFPVPGAWLYLGDTCVIHLIDADPEPTTQSADESLRMEHIAFQARDMEAFMSCLKDNDVEYQTVSLDSLDVIPIFVRDPDGNRIHVDFPKAEKSG